MAEPEIPSARALGLAAGFVFGNLFLKVGFWAAFSFLPEGSLAQGVLVGAIPLALVIAATYWLAGKPWAPLQPDIDLRWARSARPARLFGGGLAFGALMFSAVVAVLVAKGWLRMTAVALPPGRLAGLLAEMTLIIVLNAAWEEYVFRGWAFSLLGRRFGPHTIALSLGTVFGLVHLLNAKSTFLSISSVVFAGWFLSYALIAARSIAFPVGIHIGWNLAQEVLTSSRLWTLERHPDPLRSGGEPGLEGSAAAILVTAGAAAAMFLVVLRRRRRKQPAS